MPKLRFLLPLLAMLLAPVVAMAAPGGKAFPVTMELFWIIPFACMLLSIAIMPLAIPHFWHHNYGKVAVFWALAFLVPATMVFGFGVVSYNLVHTLLLEYIPFILLLLALFTVAGGIRLKGQLVGTPKVNTAILLFGTLIASWIGTTGAAMLLIRPLIRANAHRKFRIHQIVFFIFLVANIGGALTPLGDPPLFLGFLRGVDFFWTTTNMLPMTIFVSVILLAVYFVIDTALFNKEGKPTQVENPSTEKLGIDGSKNFFLVLAIIALVIMSGSLKLGEINIYGTHVAVQNIIRDACLIGVTFVSLKITAKSTRELNDFNWEPIAEVAKLFIGIFVSMMPALAILNAGSQGALADLIGLVSDASGNPIDARYFWLTGTLSAFLDNAPTYLVFFATAGGDPVALMSGVGTLLAISAGAVFMGAITYIGNAPNFMVRSIAENSGIKMPSFFGYMLWSVGILVPVFILVTFVFF